MRHPTASLSLSLPPYRHCDRGGAINYCIVASVVARIRVPPPVCALKRRAANDFSTVRRSVLPILCRAELVIYGHARNLRRFIRD